MRLCDSLARSINPPRIEMSGPRCIRRLIGSAKELTSIGRKREGKKKKAIITLLKELEYYRAVARLKSATVSQLQLRYELVVSRI